VLLILERCLTMSSDWVAGVDYATWATDETLKTLSGGYLLQGESPRGMYERLAQGAAKQLGKPELEAIFFNLMWDNKLCPASPICSNFNSSRGLPISCNGITPDDNLMSIFNKNTELAVLTKNGAGVGIYLGNLRGRGASIKGNGVSEGIVPWSKLYDTSTSICNQGGTRKGATALYLPITHPDVEEFLLLRRPTQEDNRRCRNTNLAVCITDAFMEECKQPGPARELLKKLYRERMETGEPYIFFTDNVNKANPECYKARGLDVNFSNLCSEITLYSDSDHSYICCLSSLNLVNWDKITDDDIYYSIWFLDAVLSEYIEKASKIPGMEAAVRSAVKGRAVGLGVLGWHSLLQSEGTAFGSFRAKLLNRAVFKRIREQSERATKALAKEYGEPEWCKGFGRRNTHLLAVAPTVSNSVISGSVSQGIEPITANAFAKKTAKGVFISHNKYLKVLLGSIGKDTPEVWTDIATKGGSVQHLEFLSAEQKEVFLTAYEINQMHVIDQAAERQQYIDQAQSLNLFFTQDVDPRVFHKIHWTAWERGIKSLYYCKTTTLIKGDVASKEDPECKACEG
jgi:ribonucleoside-diphosphate reductase alpha chain